MKKAKYIIFFGCVFFLNVTSGYAQKEDKKEHKDNESSKTIAVPKDQQKIVAPIRLQSASSNKANSNTLSVDNNQFTKSRSKSAKANSPESGNPNWMKGKLKAIIINDKGEEIKTQKDN